MATARTWYASTGEPPSLKGRCHATTAPLGSSSAMRTCLGCSGGPTGVARTGSDMGLTPCLLAHRSSDSYSTALTALKYTLSTSKCCALGATSVAREYATRFSG